VPPDAEPSGTVPGAEVAIQNHSIYAVVAAREQIPVHSSHLPYTENTEASPASGAAGLNRV
jgi:hypothetical protein